MSDQDVKDAQLGRRDQDRKTSNENAQRKAGWYSDAAYMSEVGKEGIKRQQEHMKDDADWNMVKKSARRKSMPRKRG